MDPIPTPRRPGLFAPAELRLRFAPAFEVRPWIYWADCSLSALCGWVLLVSALRVPVGSSAHLLMTTGSVVALFRAALFIHELAHRRRDELPGFELGWNLLIGIPLQVPSLMYVGSHLDHHKRNGFGTDKDPEYAPIARWPRLRIVLFVLAVACVPIVLPLRWGLLGPLSRLIPPLRRLTIARASTLAINGNYRRPEPDPEQRARWDSEEAAAALVAWCGAAAIALGWLPLEACFQWWLVVSGVGIMNQVRTLAAHGYVHGDEPVDAEGQLLDSINLLGWPWLTVLVAPVGMRFHALHHFLPGIPYHSLGAVHRALLRELPADAAYRRTLRDGIWPALQALWGNASRSQTAAASR